MKKCETVPSLIKAIILGEFATLKVQDILQNCLDVKGAYIRLAEDRFAYVSEPNWKFIRNSLINEDGFFCKDLRKYQNFFK